MTGLAQKSSFRTNSSYSRPHTGRYLIASVSVGVGSDASRRDERSAKGDRADGGLVDDLSQDAEADFVVFYWWAYSFIIG